VNDVFSGYFITAFRLLRRFIRTRKADGWRECIATVVGANLIDQSFLPHPSAQLVYTYRFDGALYGGVTEKPFFLASSAKDYLARFRRGGTLRIRVNPGDAAMSTMRDEDQPS